MVKGYKILDKAWNAHEDDCEKIEFGFFEEDEDEWDNWSAEDSVTIFWYLDEYSPMPFYQPVLDSEVFSWQSFSTLSEAFNKIAGLNDDYFSKKTLIESLTELGYIDITLYTKPEDIDDEVE